MQPVRPGHPRNLKSVRVNNLEAIAARHFFLESHYNTVHHNRKAVSSLGHIPQETQSFWLRMQGM